ncbi:MAG: conjugal transfer protein TraX [Oscillospiraceae bacterium]|nr:conjugal transfer protein TraX [Oscillospiraceae bacterium]
MQKRKFLNGNQIKIIAIAAMTVDHLTWAFFPGLQAVWYVCALHIVGRLTAPIMWFFIAEGCRYTRDPLRYIARLFIFAVVSHFAYDFAFGIPFMPLSTGPFNQTSVMWSLTWAAVLIVVCRSERVPQWAKILCVAAACVVSFPSDWSSIAVMCPFFLYAHRGSFKRQALDIVVWTFVYALVYFIFLDKLYGALQMFTFLTIPILARYNGERGRWKGMKWFFYIYYPAHLVVIGLVRLAVNGDAPIIF